MKILIRNVGCDDETLGLAEFEDADDFNDFIEIIKNLNQNSDYPCMPTISLYSLFKNEIIDVNEMDEESRNNLCAKDIIKWKHMNYTFATPDLYFSIITNPERDILYQKEKEKI
ncbi:MAG: hypothetical protein ACI311_02290 [Bacilli bacterium]